MVIVLLWWYNMYTDLSFHPTISPSICLSVYPSLWSVLFKIKIKKYKLTDAYWIGAWIGSLSMHPARRNFDIFWSENSKFAWWKIRIRPDFSNIINVQKCLLIFSRLRPKKMEKVIKCPKRWFRPENSVLVEI